MDNDIAKRMQECTKYGTEDCCFRPDCPHVKNAALEGNVEYEVKRERIGIFL